MRYNKKKNFFIKMVNVILLSVILIIGLILILITLENEKEKENFEKKSLINSKEESMISKEITEISKETPVFIEDEESIVEEIDPDLEYAIKLFEKNVNKAVLKNFKKQFNYKEGSSCIVVFDLLKQSYKIKKCSDNAIYKRSVQISLDKMMPIKRVTYNKVNLRKEKLEIIINTN